MLVTETAIINNRAMISVASTPWVLWQTTITLNICIYSGDVGVRQLIINEVFKFYLAKIHACLSQKANRSRETFRLYTC